MDGANGQPAFSRQIADYDQRFLEEDERRLGRIDTPVHIMWGTHDAWIPTEITEKLRRLIPLAWASVQPSRRVPQAEPRP